MKSSEIMLVAVLVIMNMAVIGVGVGLLVYGIKEIKRGEKAAWSLVGMGAVVSVVFTLIGLSAALAGLGY